MENTAQVLGVGRQTAYAQCRVFLATDGDEGIPCHRIGRRILIYRAELEAWLGFAIVWPPEPDEAVPPPPPPRPATSPSSSKRSSTRRPSTKAPNRGVIIGQASLPF